MRRANSRQLLRTKRMLLHLYQSKSGTRRICLSGTLAAAIPAGPQCHWFGHTQNTSSSCGHCAMERFSICLLNLACEYALGKSSVRTSCEVTLWRGAMSCHHGGTESSVGNGTYGAMVLLDNPFLCRTCTT